jgi:hypothetical protein
MSMSRQVGKNLGLVLFGCMVGTTGLLRAHPAAAQTPELVRFYDQATVGGATPVEDLRLVNGTSSKLCAMIYVWDRHEQIQEICGCPLSTSKEVRVSLSSDLTSNPLLAGGAGADLTEGQITIFSAQPNGGTNEFTNDGCNPAASFTPPGTGVTAAPQAGITAWMEYVTTATNEANDPFVAVPFDPAFASYAVGIAFNITQEIGQSGDGVCSCGNDSATGS